MADGDLKRRLWVAGFGIPLGIALVYLGGWFLAGVVAVLAAVGAWELYRIAGARGWRPFPWIGVPAAALFVLGAQWAGTLEAWSLPAWWLVILLTLGALGGAVFLRGPGGDPLPAVAATVLGALYVGGTLAFVIFLRGLPGVAGEGPGWPGAVLLIFPLAVTWFGDSAAYFVGRKWGRRKLIPSVSPGKTVEGGVGGLAGAMVASVLYALFLLGPQDPSTLPLAAAAVLGLLIGVLAQVGDLAESVLKREAGVKDSGALLPGHGGVLDRFDAVFFTVPVTYGLLPFLLV
jgi:phosphatidate cytidylyltransferase